MNDVARCLAHRAWVLNFLCAMAHFESDETYGPFLGKNVFQCYDIEMATFIEVNKHIWSLETINYFVVCIHY